MPNQLSQHPPLTLRLELARATAVDPSPRVMAVASMFGLGIDDERLIAVVPPTTITLTPGQVVFITGASGSGKSSILHLIDASLVGRDDVRVLRFDDLPPLPERPLIDAFDELWPDSDLSDAARLLSLAGLNDAFVMLRKPSELSDGQRYRARLAQVFALIAADPNQVMCVVLADEFGATLDRLTAKVIARNVRKWVRRTPQVCFVAATTHDDLLEALEPDILIEKHPGEGIEVLTR